MRLELPQGWVDLDRRTVHGAEASDLTSLEAALLRALASAPWTWPGKDALYREVWGHASGVSSRTLDATLHRLRAKVDPQRRVLMSRRGLGPSWQPLAPELAPHPCVISRTVPVASLQTLTGPSGMGKTHLAVHHTPALGTRYLSGEPPEHLEGWQRALIRSDDPDLWRPHVQRWLDQGIDIVWVSRHRLHLPDEVVLRLGLLSPDEANTLWHALGRRGAAPSRVPTNLVQRATRGQAPSWPTRPHTENLPERPLDIHGLANHWRLPLAHALDRAQSLLDASMLVALPGRQFLAVHHLGGR